jgi:hypothetical protein
VENQRGATLILIDSEVSGNFARRNGSGVDNDERGTVALEGTSAIQNNNPNDCVDC